MVHELTQQQTRSIEKVVLWFLGKMPAPYFRQVPESIRLDHIKAISAIKDANMDMHMNSKTHLPDVRQVSWSCCYVVVQVFSIQLISANWFSFDASLGTHIHLSGNDAGPAP